MTDLDVLNILDRLRGMTHPLISEPIPRLRLYEGPQASFLTPDTNPGRRFEDRPDAEIVATGRRIAAEAKPLLAKYDQGWRQIRDLPQAFYASACAGRNADTGESWYAWAVFTDQATRDQFVSDNDKPGYGIDEWGAVNEPLTDGDDVWASFDETLMIAPGGHHVSAANVRIEPRIRNSDSDLEYQNERHHTG